MTDLFFDPLMRPIAIALAASFICLLLPTRWDQLRGWLAVAASATSVLVVGPLFAGDTRVAESGLLRVDQLSGFILLASTVITTLIAIYSLQYMTGRSGQRLYYASLLASLAFACGVLLADDLMVLLVSWGLLAVTLYWMIGLSGPPAADAARKTFMIVGGSDALLMLGVAILWAQNGTTRMNVAPMSLESGPGIIAFLCFVAAAFAKAGAIPLHSWLPDCGEKAHAPVTAFLPTSLDKLLGIYLLVRVVRDLFQMTPGVSTLLMLLGTITIIAAVFMALVQHDLKRLLAFHAVSQVGYMVIGIATGTALGLAGGLFHMLNNAIYKSCLFLSAGVVEEKAGTVDLDRLGGLATRLPLTFTVSLIAALSISGIPPFNGFASKWMIYQALIESGSGSGNMLWVVWLTAAVLGSALTLASFVKVLHGVFLCKPSPLVRQATVQSVGWKAAVPMGTLATLCVVFGVFAQGIPLRFLIGPAIGSPVDFTGIWFASQTSGLLLISFALGWVVYAFALRNGKLRHVSTYIGGERMEETRIPGVARGPDRHVEVTGVDFYQTVERLPVLGLCYRMAKQKSFDLYRILAKVAAAASGLLRAGHNGVLSLYFFWLVLGLLGILYVIMEGT